MKCFSLCFTAFIIELKSERVILINSVMLNPSQRCNPKINLKMQLGGGGGGGVVIPQGILSFFLI